MKPLLLTACTKDTAQHRLELFILHPMYPYQFQSLEVPGRKPNKDITSCCTSTAPLCTADQPCNKHPKNTMHAFSSWNLGWDWTLPLQMLLWKDKHTYLETIPSFFARRRMESSDSPYKKTVILRWVNDCWHRLERGSSSSTYWWQWNAQGCLFFFPKQMVAFHCHRLLFLKQAVKFAFFRIRNRAW